LQPLVAQFLGLEEVEMFGVRERAQGSSSMYSTTDIESKLKRGMEDIASRIDGLEREKYMNKVGMGNHSMMSVMDNGEEYFVPGMETATNTAIIGADITAAAPQKGNTHAAAEKARRDKEEFLRNHRVADAWAAGERRLQRHAHRRVQRQDGGEAATVGVVPHGDGRLLAPQDQDGPHGHRGRRGRRRSHRRGALRR
jgi:hypothetical protein